MTLGPRLQLGPGVQLAGTPYRILRKLGAGGMGEVYEAVHEHLGTRRALKVLTPHHEMRASSVERMRLEARILARLRHKNLVEVNDLGTTESGQWFFAMELLHGQTLRKLLQTAGTIASGTAVGLVAQILDGLQAVHESKLVHRDIKPENVFVCSDGTVKILDFGIAKLLTCGADGLTETGFTLGTPRYMSPEQLTGKPVTPRADIYATGAVLYEILSGRSPFEETEPIALAIAHATHDPQPLPDDMPPRIAEAIIKSLAKDPDERFQSAEAFASELRACHDALSLPEQNLDLDRPLDTGGDDNGPSISQMGGRDSGAHPSMIRGETTRTSAVANVPPASTERVDLNTTLTPRRVRGVAVAVASVLALAFSVLLGRRLITPTPIKASASQVERVMPIVDDAIPTVIPAEASVAAPIPSAEAVIISRHGSDAGRGTGQAEPLPSRPSTPVAPPTRPREVAPASSPSTTTHVTSDTSEFR